MRAKHMRMKFVKMDDEADNIKGNTHHVYLLEHLMSISFL